MGKFSNRLVLALGFLLVSPLAIAKDDAAFTEAWQAYSQSHTKLNSANEEFSKHITPHVATFNNYRVWMDETTSRLSVEGVKTLDIDLAFNQYRDLLKSDTTCSSASLQTLQADLHASLRDLKSNLQELKSIVSTQPLAKTKADKERKRQMLTSLSDAERASLKAETTILGYSQSLGSSSICLTLSNFDLILVAAETIDASRLTANPLRLSTYLNNAVSQKSADQIKKDALDYLTAVERSFLEALKAGDINKSLLLLNRIDGNIAFGTSAVKTLSDAEKVEVEAAKNKTRSAIKLAANELNFPRFEGLQNMVNAKAKITHELLANVERQSVRASDQPSFAKVKEFCLINFHMKSNDPQPHLSLKDLSELLDTDAKLSETQYLLRALENSRELASR